MQESVFHIFLNTPKGREDLFQVAYLAWQIKARLSIHLPIEPEIHVACSHLQLRIGLDETYVQLRQGAEQHVHEALVDFGISYSILSEPNHRFNSDDWLLISAVRVPDEDANDDPQLGSFLRRLIQNFECPVFFPAGAYKKWKSVVSLFSGSPAGITALKVANQISRQIETQLTIITHLVNHSKTECVQNLRNSRLMDQTNDADWLFFEDGSLETSLYQIPHDALVVVGTGQHSRLHQFVKGNNVDKIQKMIPNPMIICGPNSWE